jgi:hypothetical protein
MLFFVADFDQLVLGTESLHNLFPALVGNFESTVGPYLELAPSMTAAQVTNKRFQKQRYCFINFSYGPNSTVFSY